MAREENKSHEIEALDQAEQRVRRNNFHSISQPEEPQDGVIASQATDLAACILKEEVESVGAQVEV